MALLAALAIAWIVGFGAATARIARARGRSADLWFAFGAVIGPLAVAIVRTAPPGECGICLSPVQGWGFRCPSCGSDVRETPARTRDPEGQASPPTAELGPDPSELWISSRTDRDPAAPPKKLAFNPGGRPPRRSRARGTRQVSSAVFLEGSEPMEPGATYALAIHGEDLRIMGPTETRPDHIVVSRRLHELATTGLGDRLIISGTSRRLDDFHVVFTSIETGTAQELARLLDAERAAVARPSAGSP